MGHPNRHCSNESFTDHDSITKQHFLRVLTILSSSPYISSPLGTGHPQKHLVLSSISFRTRSIYVAPSGVQLWDASSMASELYMLSSSFLLFLSKVPYSVVIGLLLVLSVGLGLAYCGGKACQKAAEHLHSFTIDG